MLNPPLHYIRILRKLPLHPFQVAQPRTIRELVQHARWEEAGRCIGCRSDWTLFGQNRTHNLPLPFRNEKSEAKV